MERIIILVHITMGTDEDVKRSFYNKMKGGSNKDMCRDGRNDEMTILSQGVYMCYMSWR